MSWRFSTLRKGDLSGSLSSQHSLLSKEEAFQVAKQALRENVAFWLPHAPYSPPIRWSSLKAFRNPPQLGKENEVFHPYFESQVKILCKKMPHNLVHAFDNDFLDGRKPDYSLFLAQTAVVALNLLLIIELKPHQVNSGAFSDANKMQVLDYGQRALFANIKRQFIFVMLCDCYEMEVFKVIRDNDNPAQAFRYESSPRLTLSSRDGQAKMMALLQGSPQDLGFQDPFFSVS